MGPKDVDDKEKEEESSLSKEGTTSFKSKESKESDTLNLLTRGYKHLSVSGSSGR